MVAGGGSFVFSTRIIVTRNISNNHSLSYPQNEVLDLSKSALCSCSLIPAVWSAEVGL